MHHLLRFIVAAMPEMVERWQLLERYRLDSAKMADHFVNFEHICKEAIPRLRQDLQVRN